VEPYQGQRPAPGGILRDVFTMGARPVALLNSPPLRPLEDARNRYLFAGIVRASATTAIAWRPDRRRRGDFAPALRRQSAGQRDVRRRL